MKSRRRHYFLLLLSLSVSKAEEYLVRMDLFDCHRKGINYFNQCMISYSVFKQMGGLEG